MRRLAPCRLLRDSCFLLSSHSSPSTLRAGQAPTSPFPPFFFTLSQRSRVHQPCRWLIGTFHVAIPPSIPSCDTMLQPCRHRPILGHLQESCSLAARLLSPPPWKSPHCTCPKMLGELDDQPRGRRKTFRICHASFHRAIIRSVASRPECPKCLFWCRVNIRR